MYRLAILLAAITLILPASIRAQSPPDAEPLGIALENLDYPHPVEFFPIEYQGTELRMAYMDVAPRDFNADSNGRTALLFHGKNFMGEYWASTIEALAKQGYRVVVPDQIGFGKSSKPALPYSFHWLAANTAALLDELDVDDVYVIGHSMGGMLATRFTLMYPDRVNKLVLENPIGLEDYRLLTPWVPLEESYQSVMAATYGGIKGYHEKYYAEWKPEFEKYVMIHYRWTLGGEYPRFAMASALTGQMVYEQPVVYEFPRIAMPTLVVIGQEDRTALGRNNAPQETAKLMGNYPELGKKTAEAIPRARLVPLENCGHTPHLEMPERFHQEVIGFFAEK